MKYKIQINENVIDGIRRHALNTYPDECCGIVTKNTTHQMVHECNNIQNQLHAEDPVLHQRDARTAYAIERREAEKIFSDAKAAGKEVIAFYHSHTDHDAYFSETDKEVQTVLGEPEFPDALHIVISVKNGKFDHIKSFLWDRVKLDFISVDF